MTYCEIRFKAPEGTEASQLLIALAERSEEIILQ